MLTRQDKNRNKLKNINAVTILIFDIHNRLWITNLGLPRCGAANLCTVIRQITSVSPSFWNLEHLSYILAFCWSISTMQTCTSYLFVTELGPTHSSRVHFNNNKSKQTLVPATSRWQKQPWKIGNYAGWKLLLF